MFVPALGLLLTVYLFYQTPHLKCLCLTHEVSISFLKHSLVHLVNNVVSIQLRTIKFAQRSLAPLWFPSLTRRIIQLLDHALSSLGDRYVAIIVLRHRNRGKSILMLVLHLEQILIFLKCGFRSLLRRRHHRYLMLLVVVVLPKVKLVKVELTCLAVISHWTIKLFGCQLSWVFLGCRLALSSTDPIAGGTTRWGRLSLLARLDGPRRIIILALISVESIQSTASFLIFVKQKQIVLSRWWQRWCSLLSWNTSLLFCRLLC